MKITVEDVRIRDCIIVLLLLALFIWLNIAIGLLIGLRSNGDYGWRQCYEYLTNAGRETAKVMKK